MNNYTLITCLYDLKKRDKTLRKSAEEYLDYSKNLNCNMIIYCDPELKDEILKRRIKEKTIIICKPFEELEYYKLFIDKMNNMNYAINDNKYTTNYYILIWSKFLMLKKALLLNPFNSDYFYWIDYGLEHTFKDVNLLFDESHLLNILKNNNSNKIWFTIRDDPLMKIINDENYYRGPTPRYCIGGLFGGYKDSFLIFIDVFDKYLKNFIEKNIITSEEHILIKVINENRNLVELSFGEYTEAIDNFIYPTKNVNNLLNISKSCRIYNSDKYFGYSLCKGLYDSYIKNNIKLTTKELYKLLYEYYIITYYYSGKYEAKIIGNIFIENLKTKEFYNLYLEQKDNIDSILSFCSIKIV